MLREVRRKVNRYVRQITGGDTQPWQLQVEDALYRAGARWRWRTLLVTVQRQICTTLHMDSFRILLREGSQYRLLSETDADAMASFTETAETGESLAFPASCSLVAHLKREAAPVAVNSSEPDAWVLLSTETELRTLRELGAEWLLPLHGRTGLVGFGALARKQKKVLQRAEVRALRNFGSQLGMGLETAQFQRTLQDEAARRARADRQLELAREVQERLLPQRMPPATGLSAAAIYRSAEQVGGDYYDAFPLPDGRVCYVIADVSGKGTPAALLMATLRASLRTLMLREQCLPEVLTELYAASSASRYATFAMVVYDPVSGEVTASDAGHNPPLLLRHDGVKRLECGGPVLGLLPEASYEQEREQLQKGDLLAMFTDGVTEAESAAGLEWEEDGLLMALESCEDASAEECVARVLQEVEAFTAGTTQRDDLTLVVLRRSG